jgi:hypothetical protein
MERAPAPLFVGEVMTAVEVEGLLRSSAETFLNGKSAAELHRMSSAALNGAFLIVFDSEAAIRDNGPPREFKYLPGDGISFVCRQMDVPVPPSRLIAVDEEAAVMAVAFIDTERFYHCMFIYRYGGVEE